MNNQTDHQLAIELQELYLQNKQWFNDVLFLEEEALFFQKLIGSVLSSAVKDNLVSEVLLINSSLNRLEDRRTKQKNLILKNQQLIEQILSENDKKISVDFINEHENIIEEIKALFVLEKELKKELYIIVEKIMLKNKASHLLSN